MIENGAITYAAKQGAILAWQPFSETVRSIIVAVLTTVLSYSTAWILCDLSLGIKPVGSARVSDIYAVLLAQGSSPRVIARAFFVPTSPEDREDPPVPSARLGKRTVFTLFVLLTAAPLMNVIAVILALEFDVTLTFQEARFGGLALGVKEDFGTLMLEQFTLNSWSVPVHLDSGEIPLSEFIISQTAFLIDPSSVDENAATVKIFSYAQIVIGIELLTPAGSTNQERAGQAVLINGSSFAGERAQRSFDVRLAFSRSSAERLAQFAVRLIEEWCGNPGAEIVALPEELLPGEDLSVRKKVPCAWTGRQVDGRASLESISSEVLGKVTFVESEDLEVVWPGDFDINSLPPTFFTAEGFLFLERKRSYATLLVLVILVLAFTAIGTVVRKVLHNDVGDGIECFAKEGLGFDKEESMLGRKEIVKYGKGGCTIDKD